MHIFLQIALNVIRRFEFDSERCMLTVDGFVWLDGSDSLYRQWAPGEPSDPYYENCVEMWSSSYPGYWNDARCEYYDYVYKNYVCKASKGQS